VSAAFVHTTQFVADGNQWLLQAKDQEILFVLFELLSQNLSKVSEFTLLIPGTNFNIAVVLSHVLISKRVFLRMFHVKLSGYVVLSVVAHVDVFHALVR